MRPPGKPPMWPPPKPPPPVPPPPPPLKPLPPPPRASASLGMHALPRARAATRVTTFCKASFFITIAFLFVTNGHSKPSPARRHAFRSAPARDLGSPLPGGLLYLAATRLELSH
ncbi:MAG TPA: hypothetical protein DCL72_13485 [Rhizobiales bacterium]|nr:hypothetical protein [Hyphomicrobiales bacterium]HBH41439.1 hypothetical protein [Hyphomicrobiales bacterium]